MNKPYAKETSIRRVGPLLILLVAAVALVLAAAATLDHIWGLEDTPNRGNGSSKVETEPALETAPQPQLREYLAQKQQQLESYGWLDRTQGLAHIPVQAAMRALTAPSALSQDQRRAYLMGIDSAPSGIDSTQPRQAGKAAAMDALQMGGSP